jgi:predicted thioesterase
VPRIASSVAATASSELARGDDPADEVLDQRLRHAGVDVVVRHLVADAVGAPAERQLRQVAGAEHDAVVEVGRAEEVVGAEPGLHVLEGDVVDRLAAREGVAEVGQHLPGGRADVQLLRRHAERAHQPVRVALVPSLVAKPGMV